jgi:hypothetical protein
MAKGLSADAYAVIKKAHEVDWCNKKAIAAVLREVAYRLSFGHATGDGIICEDDLRALANELDSYEELTGVTPANNITEEDT